MSISGFQLSAERFQRTRGVRLHDLRRDLTVCNSPVAIVSRGPKSASRVSEKLPPSASKLYAKPLPWPTSGAGQCRLPPGGSIVFKECVVMDEQLDRKQLQRKLELCRRLSEIACDPATSSRLAKLIEELEHSLQQAEIGATDTDPDAGPMDLRSVA
jgi:hypothetical protein